MPSAKEKILREIDEATKPDRMSPHEAREFLDLLIAEILSRIDGFTNAMIDAAKRGD